MFFPDILIRLLAMFTVVLLSLYECQDSTVLQIDGACSGHLRGKHLLENNPSI